MSGEGALVTDLRHSSGPGAQAVQGSAAGSSAHCGESPGPPGWVSGAAGSETQGSSPVDFEASVGFPCLPAGALCWDIQHLHGVHTQRLWNKWGTPEPPGHSAGGEQQCFQPHRILTPEVLEHPEANGTSLAGPAHDSTFTQQQLPCGCGHKQAQMWLTVPCP